MSIWVFPLIFSNYLRDFRARCRPAIIESVKRVMQYLPKITAHVTPVFVCPAYERGVLNNVLGNVKPTCCDDVINEILHEGEQE